MALLDSVYGDNGTLTSSTPLAIPLSLKNAPVTITLNTTYASKLIQISTNDDQSLPFTPTYAPSHASQIVAVLDAKAAWAIITGQAGDTWNVRGTN